MIRSCIQEKVLIVLDLKTGDVVSLGIDDFKKIVRHESIIDLFKQYSDDSKYKHCLWSVLNKACDMVHDEQKGRCFKNNLFLAPLQGLRDVLRERTLGKQLVAQRNAPSPKKFFIDSYKKFLKKNNEPEKIYKGHY